MAPDRTSLTGSGHGNKISGYFREAGLGLEFSDTSQILKGPTYQKHPNVLTKCLCFLSLCSLDEDCLRPVGLQPLPYLQRRQLPIQFNLRALDAHQ